MRQFEWLAAGPIPAAWDLRRRGWHLHHPSPVGEDDAGHPLLAVLHELNLGQWLNLNDTPPRRRIRMMLLGITSGEERARLLRQGYGDALPPSVRLSELEARAIRRIEQASCLPRYRQVGPLQLDLLVRDGLVAGRRLALHPREFSLLWRLADAPGRPVRPDQLLLDVWRLRARPETNSLAVHVSRLRARLRQFGLDQLIETGADGSYRLVPPSAPALPLARLDSKLALDAYLRLGEEQGNEPSIQGAGSDHAV